MRSKTFAKRNIKEVLRDPLSYIFCLGFPIIMLIIMTFVNNSIPKEANMKIFNIEYLAPGIAVFGLTFIMLFTCLQVSKDRASAFLIRLYASPMKSRDFIGGYMMPFFIIALAQSVITFLVAAIIGIFSGYTFNILNVVVSIITLIPSVILFIGFGMLFGTLFGEKSAPPLTSIIITISSILGGIWMDIESLNSGMKTICNILPFYHGVEAARMAIVGEFDKIIIPLIVVTIYAVVIYIISVFVFKAKMKNDIN